MKKEKSMPNMKSLLIKTLGVLLALVIGLPLAEALAAADSYPSKPIRLIIPFAPGGSTDIIGRLVATKLSERLGKQLVPENHGGAGGTIGMEMVAKSKPDGYTLLFTSASIATNPLLYKKVPYDPVKSFIPIAKIGHGPVRAHRPSERSGQLRERAHRASEEAARQIGLCGRGGAGSHHASGNRAL